MEVLEGTDGTVFAERNRLYTQSIDCGRRVYGERLVSAKGTEYREWSPQRSKLSAYLSNKGRSFPFKKNSKVLYLGASSGTTPSHVSDIACEGKVFCVEFAPRMFRELVRACDTRPNMMPILADATNPSEYQFAVDGADIVYADVAQKNQSDIVADNVDMFGAKFGMVSIKARSEDVTSDPKKIFRASEKRLEDRGFRILDARSLEPFEDSHEMIVFERV
jgi:fibrillarin-like pre-rRNA processing protein